ncbi:MAG TPA: FAD:protein FMN transferase [Gemmatimonadaceae bacterium]|nr:FAD:protein FMN transferase [Gemmatimonadaceae bacterium]
MRARRTQVIIGVLAAAVMTMAADATAGAVAPLPSRSDTVRARVSASVHETVVRGAPPVRVARAWPVMGTVLTITVWGSPADTTALLALVHSARDSVRLVDSLMSTYRPTSDLSRVNARAGRGAVRVSPHVIAVLELAQRDWRLSGGAFDPTVGPLVDAWGFHDAHPRVPRDGELDSLRALVGFARVEIDTAASTVRLPVRGMRLDVGGIAKGYALALARRALDDPRVRGGAVDLGGNVVVFGLPPSGRQWHIGIRHPRSAPGGGDALLGVVALDSGSVATSGDYEHAFLVGGVRYAHLIDPRSGRPAHGVMAATVIAPTPTWTDGLSAALYLVGPRRAMALADSLEGIGAIVVTDSGDGTVARSDIHLSTRAAATFTEDPALPAARGHAATRQRVTGPTVLPPGPARHASG